MVSYDLNSQSNFHLLEKDNVLYRKQKLKNVFSFVGSVNAKSRKGGGEEEALGPPHPPTSQ
jgi:hypothetical protein